MKLNNLLKYCFLLFLCVLMFVESVPAETWHLDKSQGWKNVEESPQGKYMLAVSKIKQLISEGQTDSAEEDLTRLKADFPEIAGLDLDTFMEAEVLYGSGKWVKAIRKYDAFIDAWPDSWLYDSALEREYSIAVAFLNGEKKRVLKILKLSAFEEGANIMRKIADRTGGPIAKRALTTLAKAYEKRSEYLNAFETWRDINFRWPTGQVGSDSRLRMAQTLHAAYTSPKYDATTLKNAKNYYEDFKRRSTQDVIKEKEVDARLEMIEQQLAYKQYKIGEYYERTENPQSANLYYQLVIDKWPQSTAAKMAKVRMGVIADNQGFVKPEDKKLYDKVFDAGNLFLDSWFGLKYIYPGGSKEKSNDTEK